MIWSMPLTFYSSPSSLPIIGRIGLFIVFHNSCMFLSCVFKNFSICLASLVYLLLVSFYLEGFPSDSLVRLLCFPVPSSFQLESCSMFLSLG